MFFFYAGLCVLSGASLMYQVVLTRLLSVTTWYYLAFVAVSMSMFGLTVGALLVHLRPSWFAPGDVPRRLAQSAWAMAISIPITLMTMLAIPLDLALSLQTLISFVLFSGVVAVPVVFSGIAVCLCLTRSGTPIGRTYAVDLAGATLGCFGALGLLSALDAPSALLGVSALVFVGAALFSAAAGVPVRSRLVAAAALALAALLNAATPYGIQPLWTKGMIDPRDTLLLEVWNPISRVRAYQPERGRPPLWGPSPKTPFFEVDKIKMDIDNDAGTWITRYEGDPGQLEFLRYDVASVPAELRAGGSAAIIGVGGGRDVLTAASLGYKRILGIEVNSVILDFTARRFGAFSGMSRIPGLELTVDEGRSRLTRSDESFDLIQATLVDTWAGTAAGAMALSENALYTVEAWRLFHRRLKPGGLIVFSRWARDAESYQSRRLFSLAWATLLAEGAQAPGQQLAFLRGGPVATLLLSNRPLSAGDLKQLLATCAEREFDRLYFPGEAVRDPVIRYIATATSIAELQKLKSLADIDYSPTFDDSPFFFNALRLANLPRLMSPAVLMGSGTIRGGNLRALSFLFLFLLAAAALVGVTILWPLRRFAGEAQAAALPGIGYFTAIGLAFMLVEMGMMQQLGLFLGHPIYGLAVVLAGLILFAGIGSLLSERLALASSFARRVPALLAATAIVAYLLAVPRVSQHFLGGGLALRVLVSLALVALPGLAMGLCFPAGVRTLEATGQGQNLPWMWALNGAASVLATFAAVVVAMEFGLTLCVAAGAFGYLFAATTVPGRRAPA